MSEGMTIRARTSFGTLTIVAGKDYYRTYKWDQCSMTAWLNPRRGRWNGSLGIYNAGTFVLGVGCQGIARTVAEEGQQQFETESEALAFLESRGMPVAFRNDGLAVGWFTNPSRHELDAEVWQCLIGGRKPERLAGADDTSISVSGI